MHPCASTQKDSVWFGYICYPIPSSQSHPHKHILCNMLKAFKKRCCRNNHNYYEYKFNMITEQAPVLTVTAEILWCVAVSNRRGSAMFDSRWVSMATIIQLLCYSRPKNMTSLAWDPGGPILMPARTTSLLCSPARFFVTLTLWHHCSHYDIIAANDADAGRPNDVSLSMQTWKSESKQSDKSVS